MRHINQRVTCVLTLLALLAAELAYAAPVEKPVDDNADSGKKVALPIGDFNKRVDALFAKVVTTEGLVRYNTVRGQQRQSLEELTAELPTPRKFESDREELAFYINAYNLIVLQQVVENWPVEKVTNVQGFFDKNKHKLAGRELTLNQLENDVIRPFNDPRIHAALVCAAQSCPPLLNEAFTARKLNDQLNNVANRWVNDPSKNTARDGKVYASKIFEWYGGDFAVGPYGGVRGFLRRFADDQSAIGRLLAAEKKPPLAYLEYDWHLNNARE